MRPSIVELKSPWRWVYATSMGCMGLLFAAFIATGTLAAAIAGVLGAIVFLALALRGWRSGVYLGEGDLTCRGYVRTGRYARSDIEAVSAELIYEKFFVDTWAPHLTLRGGSSAPLRALAGYAFQDHAPRPVVTWTREISEWLHEDGRDERHEKS